MPSFHNYATFYGKFQVENIPSRMKTSGIEKKYPEKYFFDVKFHSFKKKKGEGLSQLKRSPNCQKLGSREAIFTKFVPGEA